MPYYRLASEVAEHSEKIFSENANAIQQLFYDEHGALILHTKKQLDKIKGLKKVSKKEYDGLHAELLGGVEKIKQNSAFQDMENLEQASNWMVEPYSTRQANISELAIRPGDSVMSILLGGGRGDTTYIGRPNVIPEQASLIQMKVQAHCIDNETAAVGIVLTTERERPWLAFEPVMLQPGIWSLLEFNLSDLDEKKITRVDRINIVIVTEADEGYILVQDMQVCST